MDGMSRPGRTIKTRKKSPPKLLLCQLFLPQERCMSEPVGMHTSIFKGIFLRGKIEILSLLRSELRRIVCVLYELLVASRKHLVFSSKGLCYVDFHLQIAGVPIYWITFFTLFLPAMFSSKEGTERCIIYESLFLGLNVSLLFSS